LPENQNIEYKRSWRDEYLKWICGFANANGGKLYIGVDDFGEVVGVSNYKKLAEDIPNKIQNILGIFCDVNLLEKDEKHYFVIIVQQQTVPISYKGEYHYRTGSTKQVLKGQSLNQFILRKSGKSWDSVIELGADFDIIDEESIETFKRNAIQSKRLPYASNDSARELLSNLRLIENDSLRRAAVLLFGKDPKDFYISAYIKIGRFGKSDSDLLYQDIVEAPAFLLADRAIEILEKKYFSSNISYVGLHRREDSPYPYEAVREVILNAIVHRDYFSSPIQIRVYDNRLFVWNEGSLPEGLSIEDLERKHTSNPRNPILADICFKGGLIEAWGRGTIKIIEESKKMGLPKPKFEVLSGGIGVTIYLNILTKEYLKKMGLSERQISAVIYAKEIGKITNSNYQKLAEVSKASATRDLKELCEEYGIFEKIGKSGAGIFYKIMGS